MSRNFLVTQPPVPDGEVQEGASAIPSRWLKAFTPPSKMARKSSIFQWVRNTKVLSLPMPSPPPKQKAQ